MILFNILEFMNIIILFNEVDFRLVIVYRLLLFKKNKFILFMFFEEFLILFESLIIIFEYFLLVGDYNFYVDVIMDCEVLKFLDLIDLVGL